MSDLALWNQYVDLEKENLALRARVAELENVVDAAPKMPVMDMGDGLYRYEMPALIVEGCREYALVLMPLKDQPSESAAVAPTEQPEVCEHGIRRPWVCHECEESAWAARQQEGGK